MSRLIESTAISDPLQRASVARPIVADPSHPMLSGLVAVAPRLGAVMAFAALIQMSLNRLTR